MSFSQFLFIRIDFCDLAKNFENVSTSKNCSKKKLQKNELSLLSLAGGNNAQKWEKPWKLATLTILQYHTNKNAILQYCNNNNTENPSKDALEKAENFANYAK